jgi:hypothetical protein
MKMKFGKIALAATLGLATIFTLSCSGGEGGNEPSSDSVAEISSSSDGGSKATLTANSYWDGTWQIEGEPYKIQFSGNEFFFQINGIAVVKGTVAFAQTHIIMNGTHYISSSEININPPQWHPYSAVNFWKLEFDYAKNADGSVNISNFVSNNTKDGEEELPDTLLIKE